MNKIKIIIVEDHALTRIGVKTALEGNKRLEIIAEADTGELGVKLVKEFNPDMVIMDLGLPNMNGIQATKLIKDYDSNIKVLILTSDNSEDKISGALESGADAYCIKDINPIQLIPVIKSIANGGIWLDRAIAKIVLANSHNSADIHNEVSSSPLSQREIEVLQLLADGLNNIEIADKLSLSQHTIKAHLCNILQKLSVNDRTQAVVKAIRNKWIK
jgi:DNA-binding NarL/FixJ family response regulator